MQQGTGGQTTVTATERWLSEVRAGRGFTGGSVLGGVAGQYGHVQLLNPVGSAVTVIVRSLLAAEAANGSVAICRYDTALATLVGAGACLLAGATAGVATIRTEANVAELGTLLFPSLVAASAPVYPVPDWWVELGAGEGILVRTGSVNIALGGAFNWIEV